MARGLDRNDRSVRNWLIEQMRVLTDDAASDEDALYARARALELDRKDLVVRRILVQKMRLLAARAGEAGRRRTTSCAPTTPGTRRDYQLPERVSLWHVFFASQRHGGDAPARAEQLLAELREQSARCVRRATPPGAAIPSRCRRISSAQSRAAAREGVRRGASRTRSCAAPLATWIGPLASPYGVHLVWIEDAASAVPPPTFESVRGQVLESWHEERRAERLAQLIRRARGALSAARRVGRMAGSGGGA